MPRTSKTPTKASDALARATAKHGELSRYAKQLGKDPTVVCRWRTGARKPEADMRVLMSRRRPRIPIAWWTIPVQL